MSILLKKTYIEKPPFGAIINMGHPLAKSLTAAYLFNERAGGKAYTLVPSRSVTWENAPFGINVWKADKGGCADFQSNDWADMINGVPLIADADTKFSIACLWKASSTGSPYSYIVSRGADGAGAGWSVGLMCDSTTPGRSEFQVITTSPSVAGYGVTSLNNYVAGRWYFSVGTFAAASAVKYYVDGILQGVNTSVGTGLRNSGVNWRLARPATTFNSPRYFSGSVALLAIWRNRVLTAEEVSSLYINPYQIIQAPRRSEFFVAPAAITDYAYDGNLSLSLTPSNTTVREYTYTGNVSATLTPSSSRTVEYPYSGAGSLSLTPGSSSILDRVYSGAAALSLTPGSTYSLVTPGATVYSYVGAAVFSITPGAKTARDTVFTGSLGLSLTPGAAKALEYARQGSLSFSLLPSSVLSRVYSRVGSLLILLVPAADCTGPGPAPSTAQNIRVGISRDSKFQKGILKNSKFSKSSTLDSKI